jgi:hypothetical protein
MFSIAKISLDLMLFTPVVPLNEVKLGQQVNYLKGIVVAMLLHLQFDCHMPIGCSLTTIC